MKIRIASYGAALVAQLVVATAAWSHPGHSAQIADSHGHGLEAVAIGIIAAVSAGLIWRVVCGGAR